MDIKQARPQLMRSWIKLNVNMSLANLHLSNKSTNNM